MKCMQLNTEGHKGVIIDMGVRQRNIQKQSKSNNKNINNNKNKSNNSSYTWLPMATFIFSLVSCITVACTLFLNLNNRFDSRYNRIEEKIDECLTADDISELKSNVSEMESNVSEMYKDIYYEDGKIQKKLQNIYDVLDIKSIETSKDMLAYINEATIEPNDTNLITSSFESDICIGTDSYGNTYIAEDLIDQTILLTYKEDDKEIYFLGQYNENYNWDGYCVTNSYYLDGSLFGICESNFENGKRLDYKSFYLDENEWIYTNRTCSEKENVGISKTYTFNYDKIKNFTSTNVRIIDIIYVDKFIEIMQPTINTYYCGNTSNSLYNDNTGEAYYVSYFDDGTVKTLYQGNFKDGKFNDDTGNAWYIVKDVDTEYMYFKGSFKDNSPVGQTDDNTENPIDLSRINEIIQGKHFDCELKWATT